MNKSTKSNLLSTSQIKEFKFQNTDFPDYGKFQVIPVKKAETGLLRLGQQSGKGTDLLLAFRRKVSSLIKRFSTLQPIDYRTPLYANLNNSNAATIASSRIASIPGLKPADRVSIVKDLHQRIIAELRASSHKNKLDFIEHEIKYLDYMYSSRSRVVPFNLDGQQQIESYFTLATSKLTPEVMRAFDIAIGLFNSALEQDLKEESLEPLTDYKKIIENMPNTTWWGLPFLETGKDFKQNPDGSVTLVQDNTPQYIDLAKKLVDKSWKPKDHEISYWIVHRGQEAKKSALKKVQGILCGKQRWPWAEAHSLTIIGGFISPFLEARKKFKTRAALVNQASVDRIIFETFQHLKPDEWILSWDGSAYDQHMNPIVASSIMMNSILPRFVWKGKEKELSAVKSYITNIFLSDVITPRGIYRGWHGMPSGTLFTNELDSCYNEVLVYAFNHISKNTKLRMVTEQGDDAVMVLKSELKNPVAILKEVERVYALLGQEVNASKQMLSKTKCEYLKRLHTAGTLESYRSYTWTAIGMCNMESAKNWKPAMYSARWLMQLSNHYDNLPGFNTMMEWAVQGDKEYGLGVKNKIGGEGILKLAGGTGKVAQRLNLHSYATHLGVTHTSKNLKNATEKEVAKVIDVSTLSAVRWVNARISSG